jgi:hypothetical protein
VSDAVDMVVWALKGAQEFARVDMEAGMEPETEDWSIRICLPTDPASPARSSFLPAQLSGLQPETELFIPIPESVSKPQLLECSRSHPHLPCFFPSRPLPKVKALLLPRGVSVILSHPTPPA